jgi:hypothetical protein
MAKIAFIETAPLRKEMFPEDHRFRSEVYRSTSFWQALLQKILQKGRKNFKKMDRIAS